MKKYIMFLSVFIFIISLFSFNVNSAHADLLSILKRTFGGSTWGQNPTMPAPIPSPESSNTGIVFTPPTAPSTPPNGWSCPPGQVESGYTGRDRTTINCVSCPNGTVRVWHAGSESCQVPNSPGGAWTPPNNPTLPGWERLPNGTVCRSGGESYKGSPNSRYRFTYAGLGECCYGGTRDNSTGNGLSGPDGVSGGPALFVCNGPGGSSSSSAANTATTTSSANTATTTSSVAVTSSTTTAPSTPPSGWSCPPGQIPGGQFNSCISCPNGTVRVWHAGSESCQVPNSPGGAWTPPNNPTLPGWERLPNGTVCRSAGERYRGSPHPRYRYTQPGLGECCYGGVRDDSSAIPGSSVADFVCNGPGGSGSSAASSPESSLTPSPIVPSSSVTTPASSPASFFSPSSDTMTPESLIRVEAFNELQAYLVQHNIRPRYNLFGVNSLIKR